MRPVFLIGYMGCGKTTLGEVLARQMGLRFIDLDEFIEARQGGKNTIDFTINYMLSHASKMP